MAEPKPTHKVESILGGQSPTIYFKGEGQFLSSLGIDPDLSLPSNPFSDKQSGAIAPSKYTEFSSTQKYNEPSL